ncbi:unnamed protein product, partial [Mycena citricolor]
MVDRARARSDSPRGVSAFEELVVRRDFSLCWRGHSEESIAWCVRKQERQVTSNQAQAAYVLKNAVSHQAIKYINGHTQIRTSNA